MRTLVALGLTAVTASWLATPAMGYRLHAGAARPVAHVDVGLGWGLQLATDVAMQLPVEGSDVLVDSDAAVAVTGCRRHGRLAVRCRLEASVWVAVNGGPRVLTQRCQGAVRVRARHRRHGDWSSPMVLRAREAGATQCTPLPETQNAPADEAGASADS